MLLLIYYNILRAIQMIGISFWNEFQNFSFISTILARRSLIANSNELYY